MPQCLYIKEYNGSPAPCGYCMNCRNKRITGWAARMIKEDMHACMSFFITLTYDPDHLMFSPKGRPTLWPSHLTSYWKLLRKKLKSKSMKYYACGEYGSNRKRPHYHAIVFFYDEKLSPYNVFNLMHSEWKHGDVFIGTTTNESVAYVLKYISKKGSVPQYVGDDRTREFSRMSKGLGKTYIDKMKKWHHDDLLNRAYIPLPDGHRAPMPRYYKDKIYTIQEKQAIGIHMQETTPSRNYDQLKEQQRLNQQKLNA